MPFGIWTRVGPRNHVLDGVQVLTPDGAILKPAYTIQPVVKQLNVCIHDTTGCQTGLTTSCIVYTDIERVVKPV